ncbi:MAG: hypothetical protein AAFY20_13445, partial [Cyanobacteria bacterium J06639_14]
MGQPVLRSRKHSRELRFTPTDVGTTYHLVAALHSSRPVHPHGRGDNETPDPQNLGTVRFTPTGVGTTLRVNARKKSPKYARALERLQALSSYS